MVKVNAMGDTCPIPVVKTKDAIRQLGEGGGVVETLVDNEIAVQNLTKMANQKGYGVQSEKLAENEYRVTMTVGAGADLPAENEETVCLVPAGQKNVVAVISADHMGEGEGKLGKNLLKAFLYALSQQESLPKTVLFYNGGAFLTCECQHHCSNTPFRNRKHDWLSNYKIDTNKLRISIYLYIIPII